MEIKFNVKTLEIAGLHSVLSALHLPFGGKKKSDSDFGINTDEDYNNGETITYLETSSTAAVSEKDYLLIRNLVKNGDEHAKVLRGLMVWAEISAPRYWWQEFDTYRIGVEKLASNSTMHQQGKGLSTEELVAMKDALLEGTIQTRVVMFSYQALRRIYFQRHKHRLPHWIKFCEWIETLPFIGWILAQKKEEK